MPTAPAKKRTRKSTPKKEKAPAAKDKAPEKKAQPTASEPPAREVLYKDVEVSVCDDGNELTAEQARQLLGWTVPEEGKAKFSNAHLLDRHSKTVFCGNVVSLQRTFYRSLYEALMWDILQGQWEFNGESCIVGRTGLVLDGKHRFTALALAAQEWERNPERYPFWSSEPTLHTVVVFGIKEHHKVVNTIGTGKPRSLADSLYGSGMFGKRSATELRKMCRMLEYAVRLLWQRTGARDDAYNPRASHSDALEFIERHSAVLDCVEHVFDENAGKDKRIERFLSGGYCSGLMYLMSASTTDGEAYRTAPTQNEDVINLERMEQAMEYWTLLAGAAKEVQPVIDAIGKLAEVGNMSVAERVAILVKGWNAYADKGKVTPKQVELSYKTDGEGVRQLTEDPTVDGIDLGTTR